MTAHQTQCFDNVTTRVFDDLRGALSSESKLHIAAAAFSIYAYDALKKQLESIKEFRFIFTAPTFDTSSPVIKQEREFYIPRLNRERTLYGTEFEIRLRNKLTQSAIAKECAEWIRRKAVFRSNTSGVLNPFCIHETPEAAYTYLPFNEFTTTELGLEKGDNICPLIMGVPSPHADNYLREFERLWADPRQLRDVTAEVLESIETVYRENSPEFIYYVALYNIFREFLEDLSEDVLPNEATGFRQSEIWNKLYPFQKDAALAIISKLEKYNGCILADSVGLGKTFTALSVIKYYEGRNKSVLVLCPKKLNDNWQTFRSNYKNNPLVKDRLRYDILFHSDLSRESGISNGLDLAHINWGNYDLVVIDESHNFRNGGKITTDEEDDNPRENRYLRLLNRIIREGVKTKVLMLSATPVNNRFLDLKNQLQLAYEGEEKNINGKLGISGGVSEVFRAAQTAYGKWEKLPPKERSTQRLLESLDPDFFTVLDAVTIARSRRHITTYYNTAEIGEFPTRRKPVSRAPKLTDIPDAVSFEQIADTLNSLNLGAYTPSHYLLPSKCWKYEMKGGRGGISVQGREQGLRKLVAINLLKRLESSVNSFRLTLERMLGYIRDNIRLAQQHGRQPDACVGEPDFGGLEAADREDPLLVGTGKKRIALADLDYISWCRDMQADEAVLARLMDMVAPITPQNDTKLQTLLGDLRDKLACPYNAGNRKVLVFTAFSDTAQYLYNELAEKLHRETGLHVGLISGDVEARSTIPRLPLGYNALLTLFSPRSKDKALLFPDRKEEIDILFATDCISEGQNLQDCDCVINYDIHWNPVRIIQRFGRVDRIGSTNKQIQLINYWPDMELDDYIKLKRRVESRMKATVLTATGDDNLLSEREEGDLEYRRRQLERFKDEVVDIEEMDSGINIMDLGLNEFRMDLIAWLKAQPKADHIPHGLGAVAEASPVAPPGVVFVLRNRNKEVAAGGRNALHPFYLVYVREDGSVFRTHLQPRQVLDAMRAVCLGKKTPDAELCRLFRKETQDGRRMDRYSALLQKAIESMVAVKAESDVESLFSVGESTFGRGEIRGLDDFELICFLIIRHRTP